MGDGELDLDELQSMVNGRGAAELEAILAALHEHLSRHALSSPYLALIKPLSSP